MALYDIFTRLVCVHIEAHPVTVAAGVFGSRFLWVSDPLGHMVALLVLLEYDGVSKCFRSNLKKSLEPCLLEITALCTGRWNMKKAPGSCCSMTRL